MTGSSSLTATQSMLRQAKRSLRKQMASRLDLLSASAIASQSTQITSYTLDHPMYQKANKISIYISMERGEVKTEELCRQTLELGKRLYVPKFATSEANSNKSEAKFETDMRMLRIYDWEDYVEMIMNRWGIKEPSNSYKAKDREDALETTTGGDGLDLILAPGVAFDKTGGRLGHGKGYYDRYIERCQAFEGERSRKGPITIALALQEQILSEPQRIPADEQDRRLDNVITSSGPLW